MVLLIRLVTTCPIRVRKQDTGGRSPRLLLMLAEPLTCVITIDSRITQVRPTVFDGQYSASSRVLSASDSAFSRSAARCMWACMVLIWLNCSRSRSGTWSVCVTPPLSCYNPQIGQLFLLYQQLAGVLKFTLCLSFSLCFNHCRMFSFMLFYAYSAESIIFYTQSIRLTKIYTQAHTKVMMSVLTSK